MRKDQKPEIDDIKKSYIYHKLLYQKLREIQQQHEELYWGTYSTKLNMERFSHEVRRPRAMRYIEDAANNIALDKLTVNVPPQLKGKQLVSSAEEQERVDHIGVWLQNLLDLNSHVRPYFVYSASFFGALRGEEYLKVEYDPSEKLPIKISAPDPLGIYSGLDVDDNGRPLILFEESLHPVSVIRDIIEQWTGNGNQLVLPEAQEHELAYWIGWWSPNWRGVLTGRQIDLDVLSYSTEVSPAILEALPISSMMEDVMPNPYKCVPFFRGYSGRGFRSADGEISKIVVGYLRGLEDNIIQEARELTKGDTISSMYAVPPVKIEHDGTFENTALAKPTNPGDVIIDIIGRKKTSYMELPSIGPATREVLAGLREDFEHFYPGIMRGVPQPGEPAMSLISRRSQAMKQWMPLAENLYEMLVNALSFSLEIVDTIAKKPVIINGKSLSHKEIKGRYEIVLDRKSTDPEDERIRMALGKDMYPFYPDEDHAEIFLGQKNATDFVTRRTVSKFVNRQVDTPGSPLGLLLLRRALKKMEMQEELEALEADEKALKGQGQVKELPTSEEGPSPVGASPTRGVIGQPVPGEGSEVERLLEVEKALAGE